MVDDNAAILTALKICLATEFEHIITMTSPDNLVSTLAKEQSVDAVLLDMIENGAGAQHVLAPYTLEKTDSIRKI